MNLNSVSDSGLTEEHKNLKGRPTEETATTAENEQEKMGLVSVGFLSDVWVYFLPHFLGTLFGTHT